MKSADGGRVPYFSEGRDPQRNTMFTPIAEEVNQALPERKPECTT